MNCPICGVAATLQTATTATFPCGNNITYDGKSWKPVNPLTIDHGDGRVQTVHRCSKTINGRHFKYKHRIANGIPLPPQKLDMYGYCMSCVVSKHQPHHASKSRKKEDLPQRQTASACVCNCHQQATSHA